MSDPDQPTPPPKRRPKRRELKSFLCRIMGWQNNQAVEAALTSLTLASAGYTTLVLCGGGDLVPIAEALHRRVRGPDRPFVAVDPRRGDQPRTARSAASRPTARLALEAARHGTCCMLLRRKPPDLHSMIPELRAAEDVMLVMCGAPALVDGANLTRPAPVVIPPLASRTDELERIIYEYTIDASAEFGGVLTEAERQWVLHYAAHSLDEIAKATRRIAALATSDTESQAAARLQMAQVSLHRWISRRAPNQPGRRDLDLRGGQP